MVQNCCGHSKTSAERCRRAAPCHAAAAVPPSPRPKARQQGYLPLPIEIPGTAATTLQSTIKATSSWAVAPHEPSPATERPEARLRHAPTVASKRQGNQPAMSKLAAQALSCERQGFFRGLSDLGGRRNQETPQPPPSNIALRCPAEPRSARGKVPAAAPRNSAAASKPPRARKCSCSMHLTFFPGKRVAYRRRVPDGIAACCLAPAYWLEGELAAALAIARARAVAASLQLQSVMLLIVHLMQHRRCCRHLRRTTGLRFGGHLRSNKAGKSAAAARLKHVHVMLFMLAVLSVYACACFMLNCS